MSKLTLRDLTYGQMGTYLYFQDTIFLTVTTKEIADRFNITRQSARKRILTLMKLGIVKAHGKGRWTRYSLKKRLT